MFLEKIYNREPWEKISIGKFFLEGGLYSFKNDSSFPICLIVKNIDTHEMIELCCDIGAKQYANFQNGEYDLSLIAGSRDYEIDGKKLKFSRLNHFEKSCIYISKAFLLLLSGRGINHLIKRTITLLSNEKNFGINTSSSIASTKLDDSDVIAGGVLCTNEWQSAQNPIIANSDFDVKIAILCNGMEISPDLAKKLGLENGENTNFSTSNINECQYVLEIGENDFLVQDAYSQTCRAISKNPNAKVIILDKWFEKIPTAFPAFDPLLFERLEKEIPLLRKAGYEIDFTKKWHDMEKEFAKFSAPIAISSSFNSLPNSQKIGTKLKTSIIIPTRDKAELLEKCLNSIFKNTEQEIEIIIIDNGSREPETFAIFEKYSQNGVRIISADFAFNFSKLCNLGAKCATGDLLVFVNNDVEFITKDWLESLNELAANKNIGAIGARLWYDDNTLQHGGVFLGVNDACGHIFANLPHYGLRYFPLLKFSSLRSAVTGAFLSVTKEKFNEIGGFDEENFAIAFNDTDLCLKLENRGYYNCICNEIDAIHHETKSRIKDTHISQIKRYNSEKERFQTKWRTIIQKDKWLPKIIFTNKPNPALK